MKIRNQHERIIAAPAAEIAALIADFDLIWPTRLAPAPRPHGHRLYAAGLMVWEEFDRPAAARAFRVIRPKELQAEHWFELESAEGGTVVCHTVEGCAAGTYETIWRERIEPLHDLILEALLDNVEAAAISVRRRTRIVEGVHLVTPAATGIQIGPVRQIRAGRTSRRE